MSRRHLEDLQSDLLAKAVDAMDAAAFRGVQLEGTGSTKSKTAFLDAVTSQLAARGIDILSHPLAQFTERDPGLLLLRRQPQPHPHIPPAHR
jgi:hypothetical protein